MINNVEATSYEPSFFHAASHGRHGDFHATGIPPSSSGLHSVRCCPRSRQRPSSFSPPLPPSTVVARNHVGYRGRHVDSVPFNPLFGAPFIPPPPPSPSPPFSFLASVIFVFTFLSFIFVFTFLSFLPFPSLLWFAWKCVIFVFTFLSFFLSFFYLPFPGLFGFAWKCELCFYLSFFLLLFFLPFAGLLGFAWKCFYLSFFFLIFFLTFSSVLGFAWKCDLCFQRF